MATRGRRSSFRTQHSFRPTYVDFQPKSEMKENNQACFLHIQLPGFTKERIRIQFEDSSKVVKIYGERPIDGGNRKSRFRQSYTVPQICDTNKIQSSFSQGILTITMPKKPISQDVAPNKAKTPQEEKAPTPPKLKAQDSIPPKSAREEEEALRDKMSVASSSSSSKDPNALKGQKGQEMERPFDGQKPEKEWRAKGEKGQEETEPKLALKVAPIKPNDEPKRQMDDNKVQKDQEETDALKGQKGQEEALSQKRPFDGQKAEKEWRAKREKGQEETDPKLALKVAPIKPKDDNKVQKDQEESEPKPTSKVVPKMAMDEKAQKGQEETMVEAPERHQEETKPEPTLKTDHTKSITDDEPQKGQEEVVQKPKITMAEGPKKQTDGMPQRVLEEIEPEPTLKVAPKKSIDDKSQKGQEETEPKTIVKIAPRKTMDDKPQKGQEETEPCESRKPEEGVVEKNMIKEKEIRGRRELAEEDELFAQETHNNDMIGTIEKGIKEVVASTSQALTRIAEGKWDDEDKPLLINMGVSTLVLAAVGMYAFYRFSSSERT